MTEDFLHYIWKYKLFNLNGLKSHQGHEVQIISSGSHNTESGPDFFNAKIQIGEITWAGQVEIHINSTDWYRHHHQTDSAYNRVVLHVVWNNDSPVLDGNHNEIPTIELNGRISNTLINTYSQFQLSKHQLVCQGLTEKLDNFKTEQWLGRLLIERLEMKTQLIDDIHQQQKGNWSQTFFIVLAKNLGFKINAVPMQLLAEQVNFNILLKAKSNTFQLESILLGVAGLLDSSFEELYPLQLQKEFAHQKAKHNFEILDSSIWKFGGTRPSNFPTLRLSQLAQLIYQFGDLFEVLVRDFDNDFSTKSLNVSASEYWDTHYSFASVSSKKKRSLGTSSVHNILINTVAPMLFYYGQSVGSYHYQDISMKLLDVIPPEQNAIVKKWKQNNIRAKSSSQTQALIQLTNMYCKPKKCLTCGIGTQILKEQHD